MATESRLGRPTLIEYQRPDDPPDVVRYHEWGADAELVTEPDGSVRIRSGSRAWDTLGGRRWLVNPEDDMARRRRDAKGRFLPKRRKRKSNRGTPKGVKRGPKGRFRSANPPVLDRVMRGAMDTVSVIGGEAVTRGVTRQLPRAGVDVSGGRGILMEALIAVGVVAASAALWDDERARFVAAGALSAPARDMAAQAGVPVLTGALSPGLGSYVPRPSQTRALASYVPGGGSRQPSLSSSAAAGIRGYNDSPPARSNGRRSVVT